MPFDKTTFYSMAELGTNVRMYNTRMILTDYVSVGVANCEAAVEYVEGIADFVVWLPGVTHVQVEKHKVIVEKAPLFKWDEIEPRIVGLLKFSHIPELLSLGEDAITDEKS